jgi:hypothetical protein
MQMDVELAMYTGDVQRALPILRALDAEGSYDAAWLEGVPLFGPLYEVPEVAAIREHFQDRARRVAEAYRAAELP